MSQILTPFRLDRDADLLWTRQVVAAITEALEFKNFAKTRTVTAVLEIARNAVVYADGGQVRLSLVRHEGQVALRGTISDHGPGISDVDAVLRQSRDGGHGLRGVRNIAEQLKIETGPKGTIVSATFASDLAGMHLAQSLVNAKQSVSVLVATDPAMALAQQNRELLDAIATRDLLMREIHHRTANNLALISSLVQLSAQDAANSETTRALSDLDARILAIVKAHEMMQKRPATETLPLKEFLHDLASSAENAFGAQGRRISVSVGGDDFQIKSDVAIDLGLIVNELVINAFKHAFRERKEGQINLRFDRTPSGPAILVKDNGYGLSDGKKHPERSHSLVWRLIR